MHRVRAYIVAGLLLWLCTCIYVVKAPSSKWTFELAAHFDVALIMLTVFSLILVTSALSNFALFAVVGKRSKFLTETIFWTLFASLGFGSGLIQRSVATGNLAVSRAVACVLAMVAALALLRRMWPPAAQASIGAALVMWVAIISIDIYLSASGLFPTSRLQLEIDIMCALDHVSYCPLVY